MSVGKKDRDRGAFYRFWGGKPWIFWGLAVSLVCAFVFSCFYGVFRSRAEIYEESPLETADNIAWLYQSCYLLYRDLYNSQNETKLDYADIYLEALEGYEWILDERELQEYVNLLELMRESARLEEYESAEELGQDWSEHLNKDLASSYIAQGYLGEDFVQKYSESDSLYTLDIEECRNLKNNIEDAKAYFQNLESNFSNLNISYDYIIEDHVTGKYITNMSEEDRNRTAEEEFFSLSFSFDSLGNVTIGEPVLGENTAQLRKLANEAVRKGAKDLISENSEVFEKYGRVRQPADCTVTFAVARSAWETKTETFYVGTVSSESTDYTIRYYASPSRNYYSFNSYVRSGIGNILGICMLALALAGCFLPVLHDTKPWKNEKLCSLPLEFLLCFLFFLAGLSESILTMIVYVASGKAGGVFTEHLGKQKLAMHTVGILNLTALAAFFFACWYLGVCARAVRGLGLKEYIKQRSLTWRFFPFVKRQVIKAYRAVAHLDLTQDANRTIVKLLLVNAVVLFFISSLWFGGFAITLVYSLLLYVVLRRYISEIQKRYRILLKAVDEIAEGKLNVTINEDLGVFEPFREQVFKIQEGLKKAVDEEVKSQHMRAELITNMSHDLKTPLTAIITYINLLREENATEDQRKEYLATLERKSLRLKSLIEDLFEFSKANAQNITLNIMDVDIMNLVKQVAFEMTDKTQEAGLDVRLNLTEEKVILPLDSQKTYRIYENLFGNIAKYALHGTRVYVNGFRIDDTVVLTLKNISAQEITVDSSELTERFVRGDASRNTEGSGLGLAIAKSFTELQGGSLELEVDGDLFKVTTIWRIGAGPSDSAAP